MLKRLLIATVFTAGTAGVASAAPISGSFSFTGFGGTFVGGAAPTARTATGLDFGAAFSNTGNGYGTNGTALVGNGMGAFASLNGTMASIADISLGATANPYTSNPFISFGSNSNITLNFTNAAITRSATDTSITVAGMATYEDGIAADTTPGMFSISANSQGGDPSSLTFTFTGNSSASAAVPEPISISLLGAGLVGMGAVRLRRKG